jgi:carbamoyl-phosphate synthase small subunit
MKAIIVMEDGSAFNGVSIGVGGERIGEVVLNTAVVGYQEMMTDPANAGKILVLTYPLIGNYGVANKFNESKKCWVTGLVIKEASRIFSNWQAEGSFSDFLKNEGVLTISDVDTRTLAVGIRDNGEMLGIISTSDFDKESLLKKIASYKNTAKRDHIKEISVKRLSDIKTSSSGPTIAVLDLGMVNSFIAQLKTLGCNIKLMPYDTDAGAILDASPDGLIISGGPENDTALPAVAGTVKALLGKIPMMGIGTGHQVIGLALGARLKRMKVGHHGVNYPVKGPDSFKGEITVQNHSFVIDEASLKNRNVSVTLRNIHDRTVEERESRALKFLSTQYCPASPGFDEVNGAFKRFLAMARSHKGARPKKSPKSCREVINAKT